VLSVALRRGFLIFQDVAPGAAIATCPAVPDDHFDRVLGAWGLNQGLSPHDVSLEMVGRAGETILLDRLFQSADNLLPLSRDVLVIPPGWAFQVTTSSSARAVYLAYRFRLPAARRRATAPRERT